MGAFAPFEPDRALYNPNATNYVMNVVPVADGWGPMPDLVVYSEALPTTCYGAVYIRDSAGAFSVIAGTQTNLYLLNPATLAWDDISGPAAPYGVPDSDRWSFAKFGTKLLASNIADPLQEYDIDAPATFVSTAGSPPQAKYVTVTGGFVVLAHLANLPQRVQWSGIEDHEYWTSGFRASDYQDFPDGEDITGIFGDDLGAVVMQRRMIRTMTFDPASGFVFRFNVANPSRGSIAPLSIVQIGPRDFIYLCEDGWFRGIAGQPIGAERVDRWFLETAIDQDDFAVVRGVADPYKKIAWFQYQADTGLTGLIGYNWQLDRWTQAENDITELLAVVSIGYTLDSMDPLGELDDIGTPLDSRRWLGGAPTFGAFNTDNELCFFAGSAKEAVIQTADEQPTPGMRSFVSPEGIRVLTDAGTYTLKVTTSNFPGGTRTQGSSLTPSTVTGLVPCRRAGLLFSSELTIPAGTAWKHAVGIEYGAIPEGKR
jgi:hypothetical protein